MTTETTFTVSFPGIAADDDYVIEHDGDTVTLYILDDDGDREPVESATVTETINLAALSAILCGRLEGSNSADLSDAVATLS